MKQAFVWIGALIVGAILGLLQISSINETANFIAPFVSSAHVQKVLKTVKASAL